MADPAVISVLAFLHIVSAVAWLGGAVYFVSSIGPTLRSLSPAASLEFLVKVGPRNARFFGGAATLTVVFGLALLVEAFGTNYGAWPASIEVGFGLGFIAYLVAVLLTIPTSLRVDKIAHEMMNNPKPGPPPPGFVQGLKRLNIYIITVTVLLLLTAVYMVGTAFPF